MTARVARFEICRGIDGWWARFRAANGRIVWTTETYARRGKAELAVMLIVGEIIRETPWGREISWQGNAEQPTEVRTVDEREVTR
jgi:uncharacterized protein YegP (UPF0339 family)